MDAVADAQPVLTQPRNTLDPKAIPAWRVTTGAAALVVLAIWTAILVVLHQTGAYDNVAVLGVIFLAGLALAALVTWYGPRIEWRHWRSEVRDEEIDLQSGMVTITRVRMGIIAFLRMCLNRITRVPRPLAAAVRT